ncbi:cytochrome b561 domain-containing protein At2g30890 [Trichoderma asperellum]|uniref:Cytochrome b561 domain-containing protein At2g30890 n=1 Tax=Trichoderma asperellum TaxID=101201 RepID=A0A6V8R0C5_TRIAP|nr:cytochrome b561 domain-containing protein At2g30890 [Trichoderma asperellum]
MLSLLLHLLFLLLTVVSATPSQYCLSGLPRDEVDFCMAVSLYHNHSTEAHDVYLSFAMRRSANSSGSHALGWTAIGAGPQMAGSLMFVLYGDPESSDGADPTLSVRTVSKGHALPQLIAQNEAAKDLDVRVSETKWTKTADGELYVASASIICYACSKWQGTEISPETASQPWIWAWNKQQRMRGFPPDQQLEMHTLLDGYGHFYVDMKEATSHKVSGPPAIVDAGEDSNIGTSDRPMEETKTGLWQKLISRPLAHLHGFFMMAAFLVLFPAGAVAIRSGSDKSFRFHWLIQLAGLVSAFSGAVLAIIMSDSIFASPHQIAGVVIFSLLIVQALLGWRHHMDFIRIFRRTWISYTHVYLGAVILLAGWANVISGLVLYGFSKFGTIMMGLFILLELLGVGAWSFLARRRSQAKDSGYKETPESSAAYFALDDIPESDEEDDVPEDRGLMQKGDERN